MSSTCLRANLVLLASLLGMALLSGCTSSEQPSVRPIEPVDAVALLDERDDVTVIDVRTPEEYEAGHLAEAQLLDYSGGEFAAQLDTLDPEATYLLYCRTGNRSAQAGELMEEQGFEDVYVAGGYQELAAAGAPTAD